MKKIYLFCISLFIFCCNRNDAKGFTINGKVSIDIPKYIYLKYDNVYDSSLVENGRFHFKGKVDSPTIADLLIPPISSINEPFYIENSNINITVTNNKKKYKNHVINFIEVTDFNGTRTSKIQADFNTFMDENIGSKDWDTKLFSKVKAVIEVYPKHPYSADLLKELANDSIFDIPRLKILYEKLDRDNPSRFSIGKIRNIINPYTDLLIGNDIPDFKLPNQDSNIVTTRKFRNSLMLIDFWASWCIPCRKKNKELIKIYEKYKDKGFVVLGVSVDTKRNKWLEAITKDKLEWENVIEIDGLQGEVSAMYGITYLPYNVLVSEDGKILDIDITFIELEKKLEELLK